MMHVHPCTFVQLQHQSGHQHFKLSVSKHTLFLLVHGLGLCNLCKGLYKPHENAEYVLR